MATYKDLIDNYGKKIENYSASASTIGRNIIWALVGTIWLLIYNKEGGKVCIPNGWIGFSFFLSFVYLSLDYIQYVINTLIYQKTEKEIKKDKDNEDLVNSHVRWCNEFNAKYVSFVFYGKSMVLVIGVIAFFIGIINYLF